MRAHRTAHGTGHIHTPQLIFIYVLCVSSSRIFIESNMIQSPNRRRRYGRRRSTSLFCLTLLKVYLLLFRLVAHSFVSSSMSFVYVSFTQSTQTFRTRAFDISDKIYCCVRVVWLRIYCRVFAVWTCGLCVFGLVGRAQSECESAVFIISILIYKFRNSILWLYLCSLSLYISTALPQHFSLPHFLPQAKSLCWNIFDFRICVPLWNHSPVQIT